MLKTVALDTNSEQTHHEPLLVLGTVDAALDGVYTYQVRFFVVATERQLIF